MNEESSFHMKVKIDDHGGGGGDDDDDDDDDDDTRDAFTMAVLSHRKPASDRMLLHSCCVGSHHKWDTLY